MLPQRSSLLGAAAHFALRHVEDFANRVPEAWRERAGVMMPLYQAAAMWISFSEGWRSVGGYPCAIKVAAGKINAISGKPWKPELDDSDRDYIVVPEQPWLDGFCVAKDVIRQFVAMPLGSGYSVEITSGELFRVEVAGELHLTRMEYSSDRGGYYSIDGYELRDGIRAAIDGGE